jgi:hypothetical protein
MNDYTNAVWTRTLLHRHPEGTKGRSVIAGGLLPGMSTVLMAVCAFALWQAPPLHAQEHKSKVPIVGKLTSPSDREAYSGKIQSLDMKQKILSVDSLHSQDSEIFPFKKNVRVESLDGGRMDLRALKPGTTVLIYFNQKSGERTIRNIVVLGSGKEQAEGKRAPSS